MMKQINLFGVLRDAYELSAKYSVYKQKVANEFDEAEQLDRMSRARDMGGR